MEMLNARDVTSTYDGIFNLTLQITNTPQSQQCDEMARLFVSYLSIYNNKNLTNGIKFWPY